jgi:hypothetical protein
MKLLQSILATIFLVALFSLPIALDVFLWRP